MREPIWMECEGGEQQGNVLGPRDHYLLLSCTMCGSTFVHPVNRVPRHKRRDILAMVERGDFG